MGGYSLEHVQVLAAGVEGEVDEFLAGALLAEYEHACFGRHDHLDPAQDLAQGGRAAEDVVEGAAASASR